MLKGKSREQYLPPHLPVAQIEQLPSNTGVYYFYNNAGKVIYVGKAKNIRKRVKSHFSNNKTNRQKQEFLKETYRISYKECGTELMAHILESSEIRKLWPVYNRAQRGYLPLFGLYTYEDRQGFVRLAIEKQKQGIQPIYSFNTLVEGQNRLREMVQNFGLCPRLNNLSPLCDCAEHSSFEEYNQRAIAAIEALQLSLPTFVLVDEGVDENEHSCILIQNGNFAGMGYIRDRKRDLATLDTLKQFIEPFQDNDFIRNLVYRHAREFPHKCVGF
jgi:DNA polymerase-3 subunit epsilon